MSNNLGQLIIISAPSGAGKTSVIRSVIDKLNQLKKPINLEKEVKTIKKIITHPNRVYGHGLISVKDFEKVITRLEVLEEKVREIRIHLKLNDNMDLLK